jgi:hypothetical protein
MASAGVDDFDRSFDYFVKDHVGGKVDSFLDDFTGSGQDPAHAAFDGDVFQFPATASSPASDQHQLFHPLQFAAFPVSDPSQLEGDAPVVHVAIREQLSAMYDDFTQEGSIAVTGSICVKSAQTKRFHLVVKDEESNIQRLESIRSQKNVLGESGKRELRVDLKGTKPSEEVLVANYFCSPKLRPVPLVSACRSERRVFVLPWIQPTTHVFSRYPIVCSS